MIKKFIFNKAIILVYFKYFLSCPQPYLIKTNNIKGVFSSNISAKNAINIFFNSIFARGIFVWGNYISVELFGISKWSISIDILSIKFVFINMLLDLIEPYNSLIIINLFFILKSL